MKNARIAASGGKTTRKNVGAFLLIFALQMGAAPALFGQWIENAAHQMYFLEGNVGVGLNAPTRLLHLRVSNSSTTTGQLYIQQNYTGDAWMNFGIGTTGRHYAMGIDNAQGDDLFKIATATSATGLTTGTLLSITPGGNVSIGTDNTTYKLNVNGTIRATEIRVETGWADYVFGDGYRLRPLSEVEQYIREHRRLPGVTSAAEIQEDGLQVAKQMTEMMEKVEELTLYIIELNKRLEQLEQENAALKSN